MDNCINAISLILMNFILSIFSHVTITKNMPAHIKSSLFGCDLTIPITDGKLNLGTWQGVYLCEHRDFPHTRKMILTVMQ